MIPTVQEIATALYGAYRLARFDAAGMTYFDDSITGFWRSFFAAAIVAPLYAIMLAMRYAAGTVEVHLLRFAILESIIYVILWLAFPVVMIWLARLLLREAHYLRYIVAYNWAAVLQNALYLPLVILAGFGTGPAAVADGLVLVALMVILVYTWFVTRTALAVSAATAAGVVLIDLMLSIFINFVNLSAAG